MHLKTKAPFLVFVRAVFGNRLNLFPFFVFLRVFVFLVFVFKTSNRTLVYSAETCFVVLETENLFSKQVAKQAPSLILTFTSSS
jgi:hypothetical protein